MAKPNQQGDLTKNSSIKAMRKLTKMVWINIFRTLQVNQRLAAIQGGFIQEIQLNLDKNSELRGVLICTILIPLSQALWYPWKLTANYHGENQQCGSHHRGRTGLEVLYNLIFIDVLSLHVTGSFLEYPDFRLFSFDLTHSSPYTKIFSPVKFDEIFYSCLNLAA